jgi:hypothetical protein
MCFECLQGLSYDVPEHVRYSHVFIGGCGLVHMPVQELGVELFLCNLMLFDF